MENSQLEKKQTEKKSGGKVMCKNVRSIDLLSIKWGLMDEETRLSFRASDLFTKKELRACKPIYRNDTVFVACIL